MKKFFLSKIRLTYYYPIFFLLFITVLSLMPKQKLDGGPLTLFSVNSFLLAFYLGPILAGQKTRIDELAKAIRNEAITFFNIAILAHDLSAETKHHIKDSARDYLRASARSHKPAQGEAEYEKLLRYCIDYKGKDADQVKKIRDVLVANQQNRGQLSVLLQATVFSHEWFVLLVLFCITLSYILIIDYGQNVVLHIVAAFLCTGLSLLLLILAKLATLTHKKALVIWKPFDRLLASDFKHIDQA